MFLQESADIVSYKLKFPIISLSLSVTVFILDMEIKCKQAFLKGLIKKWENTSSYLNKRNGDFTGTQTKIN